MSKTKAGFSRFLIPVLVAGALAGCTSAALTSTVREFGDETGKAVVAQRAGLLARQEADEERIRAGYAARRETFVVSPDCRPSLPVERCRLLDHTQQPLEEAFRAENLLALGDALQGYASALSLLAADSNSDTQAFSKSLQGLATSVGALEGAVSKASPRAVPQPTLNAIASIVGTSAELYFQARRVLALRRIIVESDPLVQQATTILAETDEALRSGTVQRRLVALHAARRRHEAAVLSGASESVVRARQDELFLAYKRLQEQKAVGDGFLELGKTHADLAKAASAGASAEDLLGAIQHLATAAKSIAQAASTLTP